MVISFKNPNPKNTLSLALYLCNLLLAFLEQNIYKKWEKSNPEQKTATMMTFEREGIEYIILNQKIT